MLYNNFIFFVNIMIHGLLGFFAFSDQHVWSSSVLEATYEDTDAKMTDMNTHSYLLSTGAEDATRLDILNSLYNPASCDWLRVSRGMRVLTVGCGIGLLEIDIAKRVGPDGCVLATDISPDQLAIAKRNQLSASVENVQFVQLDIADLYQISEQFNRVHCRFVLSHMSWTSILQLLPLLFDKVAPGGALVLEEITSLDSLSCYPFSEGYEIWKAIIRKQFQAQGSDPNPGKHLYTYIKSQGYKVRYHTYQPLLCEENEKRILSLGVRSVASGLINKNLATPQEIELAIQKLRAFEQDPKIQARYCEISQLYITRPQDSES